MSLGNKKGKQHYDNFVFKGWDQVRKERYESQQQMGIIEKSIFLSERDAEERKMATTNLKY